MITLPDIWNIIRNNMPRGNWVSLEDIYRLIETHGNLDSEDFEPQAPNSQIPKWKRNVRNILQYRKRTKEIMWDENARYALPK